MNGMRVVRAMVLCAGILLAGGASCDKKEDAPKTPAPAPPTPDVTPQASNGAGASVKSNASGGAPAVVSPTTGPARTQTPAPKSAGDAGPAVAPADEAAQQSRRAQELLAHAIGAIKDNKLDDARASLDEVEAMKAALPTTTREQLKSVRANLDSVERLQNPEPSPAGTNADNK